VGVIVDVAVGSGGGGPLGSGEPRGVSDGVGLRYGVSLPGTVDVAVGRAREGTQAARINIPTSVRVRVKPKRLVAIISKSSLLRTAQKPIIACFWRSGNRDVICPLPSLAV